MVDFKVDFKNQNAAQQCHSSQNQTKTVFSLIYFTDNKRKTIVFRCPLNNSRICNALRSNFILAFSANTKLKYCFIRVLSQLTFSIYQTKNFYHVHLYFGMGMLTVQILII